MTEILKKEISCNGASSEGEKVSVTLSVGEGHFGGDVTNVRIDCPHIEDGKYKEGYCCNTSDGYRGYLCRYRPEPLPNSTG